MSFDKLIGLTVTELHINEESDMLYFTTSEGVVVKWEAFGDCCSHSWFNDILVIPNLINNKIEGIEDLGDIESFDQGCDLIQVYGYRLTTSNGYTEVIFRNESNGYYGGYLKSSVEKSIPDGLTDLSGLIDWSA